VISAELLYSMGLGARRTRTASLDAVLVAYAKDNPALARKVVLS